MTESRSTSMQLKTKQNNATMKLFACDIVPVGFTSGYESVTKRGQGTN